MLKICVKKTNLRNELQAFRLGLKFYKRHLEYQKYLEMNMKKKIYVLISSLIVVLSLISCSSLYATYDYDQKANFFNYKTFCFHAKELDKLEINDLDKRRIVASISKNLEEKGLKKIENKADLFVKISFFTKEKVNVYNNWPYGYIRYGPWWSGGWGMQQQIQKYNEGSILIDLIDANTNLLVWQGKGGSLNLDELEEKEQRIQAVVKAILINYPPCRKS